MIFKTEEDSAATFGPPEDLTARLLGGLVAKTRLLGLISI
jgi:hypothetical protein